jgi:hypothetical protein
MHRVEANVTARLDAADAGTALAAPSLRTIRRQGDAWTLEVDGTTLRVRHCKGMTILAELLRHPGRAFHVRDLLAAEGDAVDAADLGPVLDVRARLDYRRRIAELRGEEDDAEAQHDLGRVERARDERARLEEALAQALGLGGRARHPGGATERARLVVRKRIRVALERIRAADTAVAHHLETAIRTGTLCVYRPAPDQHRPWLG